MTQPEAASRPLGAPQRALPAGDAPCPRCGGTGAIYLGTDVITAADLAWAEHKPNVLQAIRTFRYTQAGGAMTLRECKDAIEAARVRNP